MAKTNSKTYWHSKSHTETSWNFYRKIGSPKFWVAPMVDASELPFRMLCRKYGATGAYTPMMHAKNFLLSKKYRNDEFSTCKEDRPLIAQFCANDPEILLEAAKLIQNECDAIDLNLGCPQRIAKRGNYGAYLMDNHEIIQALVTNLAKNLEIPITCKIRIYEKMEDTIEYARMLERAGCSMLGVHGRTRDQKDAGEFRADWEIIKAIKNELSIPIIANGNIRHIQDAIQCMEYTGADGVMSALSLLKNPALFFREPIGPLLKYPIEEEALISCQLFKEYLDLVEEYPVKLGIVKAHFFRMFREWLTEFVDLREKASKGNSSMKLMDYKDMVNEIEQRIRLLNRSYPIALIDKDKLIEIERNENKLIAIENQKIEENYLLVN